MFLKLHKTETCFIDKLSENSCGIFFGSVLEDNLILDTVSIFVMVV